MIPPEKQHQAFRALHRVLIRTRLMGYEGKPPREIADVLDWAELLPVHLAADEDRTGEFRNVLAAIDSGRPGFEGLLAIFDSDKRPRF
jgi:hypothetical protein